MIINTNYLEIYADTGHGAVSSGMYLHGELAKKAGTNLVALLGCDPFDGVVNVVVHINEQWYIATLFSWFTTQHVPQALVVLGNDTPALTHAALLYGTKGKI